jgi:signal peptidase
MGVRMGKLYRLAATIYLAPALYLIIVPQYGFSLAPSWLLPLTRLLLPLVSAVLTVLIAYWEVSLKLIHAEYLHAALTVSLLWLTSILLLSIFAGAGINPYTPTWGAAMLNALLLMPVAAGKGLVAKASQVSEGRIGKLGYALLLVLFVNPGSLTGLTTILTLSHTLQLRQILDLAAALALAAALLSAANGGALAATLLALGFWAPTGLLAWAPIVPPEVYSIMLIVAATVAISLTARSRPTISRSLAPPWWRQAALPVAAVSIASIAIVFSVWQGYWLLVVLTGSMKPAINPGDIILVSPLHSKPKVGDVVAYVLEGHIVLHRVVRVYPNGTIVTKGDANTAPDKPVKLSNVKGVLRLRIPYLGLPTLKLAEATGSIIAAQLSPATIAAAVAALAYARQGRTVHGHSFIRRPRGK